VGPYVWCVIGAVMGWVAVVIGGQATFILRVESVLVGVFGAFLGGDFAAAGLLPPAVKGAGLTMPAVLLAIGGAGLSLLLLFVMRKAVGPLKQSKKRNRE
jgi:hypothetical protein